MKPSIRTYVVCVGAAALLVSLGILAKYPVSLAGPRAWSGVLALMTLTTVAEGLGVGVSAGRAVFSVSLIPTVATVPLFGPAVAVVSTAISHILAQFLLLKKPPVKAVFNVSQLTLAVGVGSVVYTALGGPILEPQLSSVAASAGFPLLAMIPPLGGLIVTYFVTNIALVSGAIALDAGKRLIDILRELAPVAFANELASSSFSLFVVFAFWELGLGGLIVVLLPLFFVHHAFGVEATLLKQNREILQLLVKTIEAKDPYTSGHSMRVASLCRELALALGVPARKIDNIETAALLHDIGKIDFAYAELISSPAKLTDAEREIIRSHPERGARLLASISSLSADVIAAVRHHHEHYDGSGYPQGLAGDDIPLAARIIMVVDTVDAMLSNRPYRSALSVEEVTAELRRFAGRQFDPVIAAKFIESGMVERAAQRAEAERTPLPSSEKVPAAGLSVS